jgi:hypothetical protein
MEHRGAKGRDAMWRMAIISAAARQVNTLDEFLLAELFQQAVQRARPEQLPTRQGGVDGFEDVDANERVLGQRRQDGARDWP